MATLSPASIKSSKTITKGKQPSKEIVQLYVTFTKEAENFSNNIYSIASQVGQENSTMAALPVSCQFVHNLVLNIMPRADMFSGYVKRIYVNKQFIEKGDEKAIIDDDEYLFGDLPIAKDLAPLFKRLWKEYMSEDEKTLAIEYFKNFNDMIEQWILMDAYQLFEGIEKREFDVKMLKDLKVLLIAMDKIDEKKLEGSKEQNNLFLRLIQLRKEYLVEREINPVINLIPKNIKVPKVATTKVTEKATVTVKKEGNNTEVEATDVKVTKQGTKTKVETVTVKREVKEKEDKKVVKK